MKFHAAILLFLPFIFTCCDKTKVPKDAYEIESDIYIYEPEESNPWSMTAKTVEEYGCVNYSLITDFSVKNEKIDIHFKWVEAPDICLTAIGGAVTELDFSGLDAGVYQVNFESQGEETEAQLTVSDSLELVFLEEGNVMMAP